MGKCVRPGDRVLLFHRNLEMAVEKSWFPNGDHAAQFLAKMSAQWSFALSFLQVCDKVRRPVGDDVLNCFPKGFHKICKQPLITLSEFRTLLRPQMFGEPLFGVGQAKRGNSVKSWR